MLLISLVAILGVLCVLLVALATLPGTKEHQKRQAMFMKRRAKRTENSWGCELVSQANYVNSKQARILDNQVYKRL